MKDKNCHLDVEDFMEIVSSYLNTGKIGDVNSGNLQHLRECPECNEIAAAFLLIQHHLLESGAETSIELKRNCKKIMKESE